MQSSAIRCNQVQSHCRAGRRRSPPSPRLHSTQNTAFSAEAATRHTSHARHKPRCDTAPRHERAWSFTQAWAIISVPVEALLEGLKQQGTTQPHAPRGCVELHLGVGYHISTYRSPARGTEAAGHNTAPRAQWCVELHLRVGLGLGLGLGLGERTSRADILCRRLLAN